MTLGENDNLLHHKGYSVKPEYSVEDKVFYGKIWGIDDLADFYSENAKSIEIELQKAVDDYLTFCTEIGKEPQKEYSGMFNARISPELHRKLSMVAQSEGVSLNKVVEQAISSYV